MSEIKTVSVVVTTTGAAGSAAGSANSGELNGWLLDVWLDFHASAPATTDVTIAYAAHNNPQGQSRPSFGNIVVKSNSNTDALLVPRQEEHDGTGVSMGAGALFPLNGPLTVSVAQCDALTGAMTAYIRYLTV